MKQKRNSGRKTRAKGSSAIAQKLGVSRATLWRTINGKTKNPELLSRYKTIVILSQQSAIQPH